MVKLSNEARVLAATFWRGYLSHTNLSFVDPSIIHPKTRKGLNDLVKAGLLTFDKPNENQAKLVWTPTPKMATDGPKLPTWAFMQKHTFPLTKDWG